MCGLAGYFRTTTGQDSHPDLLMRMMRAVAHRGPDSDGSFVDDQVALGFQRLSIIDLANGNQPFFNEDRSIVSVCNGEIFNYKDIRSDLLARGHRLRTQCDAEVLVHLFEDRGMEMLGALNGQFAFVIYDRKHRRLFIARDQFGIAPLFYAMVDGEFVFASEMKAILEHPRIPRRVNLRGLNQILSAPGMTSPTTIFEGISSLESGHYLEVTAEGCRNVEYWDLDYPRDGESDVCPASYYVEGLAELLLRSVKYRLQSEVPVGLYLSGGLDSSLVAAMTKHVQPDFRPHSFSISFRGQEMCEGRYQRLMAKQIGSIHHDIPVDAHTVLSRLPAAVYYSETPLKETYNTASLELSSAAKSNGVSVVLAGEGADELFAGYIGYRFDNIRRARNAELLDGRGTELSELYGLEVPIFYELDRVTAQSLRSEILSAEVNEWLRRNGSQARSPINPSRLEGRHVVHQRSYLDFKLRLSDHLLSDHGDRMALAHAVEARYPFLDIDVVNFARCIPPELKLNGYVEKHIVKEIARSFVHPAIVSREKFGWFTPGSPTLLRQRRDYVEHLLSPGKIKSDGYFNPVTVEDLKKRYLLAGFTLAPPFEPDLLAIVITFGLLLDLYRLPAL